MNYSSAKLLAIVETAGISPKTLTRLLQPFNMDAVMLADIDQQYSLRKFLAIFRVLVAHVDNAETIFRAGYKFQLTDFGVFGLAVMSQPDLRSALQFTLRYRPLTSPMMALDVQNTDAVSCLIFNPLPGAEDEADIYSRLLDFNMAMFISLIENAIERDDYVKEIHLTKRADHMTHDILSSFGYKVKYPAAQDALLLADWAMETPMRHKSSVGAATAMKLCSDTLVNIQDMSAVATETRAVIIANVDKPLNVEFVAHRLGISERSLRRKLGQENLSFRNLKRDVQDNLACRYLSETRMSVGAIATAVGYTDVANFRRAFRSYHGMSPAEYRRRQGSDVG